MTEPNTLGLVSTSADYLAMQRRYYDGIVGGSAERARKAVHPAYEDALREAKYWLAYVLRDYTDRQGIAKGATIDEIVNCLNASRLRPILLDFGCGVGRLMEACAASKFEVDGVDISVEMLKIARNSSALAASGAKFFLSSGGDCGSAPRNHYDIVYSMLCFQHICVHSVRQSILASMRDCLNDRGMIYIQTHFFPGLKACNVAAPHAPWTMDNTTATGTNSAADTFITADELGNVYNDFSKFFSDVRLQFVSLPESASYHGHATEHLVISGSKQRSLVSRTLASRD